MIKKIIFLSLITIFISGCVPNSNLDIKTVECFASKSTLYVATGCLHCAQQENMFGNYYQHLNVVNCKIYPEKCLEVDVTGVPTWIIDDKQYKGARTIEELKEIMDC